MKKKKLRNNPHHQKAPHDSYGAPSSFQDGKKTISHGVQSMRLFFVHLQCVNDVYDPPKKKHIYIDDRGFRNGYS